ncbi:MAG: hypothetical protein HKN68_13705, partial [Saprospiraceae bacterium]|nr:hypothetical protein [Saprospiraceae bacterium]
MQGAWGYIRAIYTLFFLFHFYGIRTENIVPPPHVFNSLSQDISLQQENNSDDLSRSGKWKNYSDKVKKARQVVQKVKDAANFLNTLTGNGDLVSLPVGIQVGSPDGSYTATMVIEDIRIFQNYTQLFVTLEIEAPILGEQPIIFYSSDIKFSAQAGIIGDATLALMTDFPINVVDSKAMLLLKGGLPKLGDPKDSRTYATIGCNGFESLNIAGEVIFSRDWMLPVSEPLDPRPPNRVTGAFNIKDLDDPSQIFAEVDITPFKIRNGDDFVWRVKKLSIDLSEKWSPDFIIQSGETIVYETRAGLKFHDLLDSGNSWKGFYAQEISVSLPEKLTGGKDINIYADDLIIDHAGLSGYVGVSSRDSLLQFGDVSLSGWAFSIDGIELVVVETYDWAVQFGGLIYIPVFTQQGSGDKGVTEADALFYEATIDPENGYLFTTGPSTEMEMDLWLAQATILPSTTFSMGYSTKDDAIITRAVINANIGIGGSLGDNLDVNLPELGVRQLTVQNIGTPIVLNTSQWELSASGPVNVGVFEFGINPGDTSTLSSATDSSLPQPTAQVDIKSYIKLTRTESLTGQGGFSVEGEMVRNGDLDQWVNKDFRLKEVYVQG